MSAADPLYRSAGFVETAPYEGSEAAMTDVSDVAIFMETRIR